MKATANRLDAVLTAATNLLVARREQMDTVEEWAALARAVAACMGGKTADLLPERLLRDAADYRLPWNEAVDGPLPERED